MKQHIYNRIKALATDFETATGVKPTGIYLGLEEWIELTKYMGHMHGIKLKPGANEINGFTYLYVPVRSHIGLSIQDNVKDKSNAGN